MENKESPTFPNMLQLRFLFFQTREKYNKKESWGHGRGLSAVNYQPLFQNYKSHNESAAIMAVVTKGNTLGKEEKQKKKLQFYIK